MEAGKTATSACEGANARDRNDSCHAVESTVVPKEGGPNQPDPSSKCSQRELQGALSVVEGKWKALIICELMAKNMRYHELVEDPWLYQPSYLDLRATLSREEGYRPAFQRRYQGARCRILADHSWESAQ